MFKRLQSFIGMSRSLGRSTAVAAVRYSFTKPAMDKRFGRNKPRGTLMTPGSVVSHQHSERGITITTQHGALRIAFIAPDCVQVRFQPTGKFPVPFSYAVAKVTWPEVRCTTAESDEAITVTGGDLTCQINRSDSTLTIKNTSGQIVYQDAAPISWRTGEFSIARQLPAEEACFGLATQPVGLDLRGKRYILWNTDPSDGTGRNKIPTYYTIPFYLGVQRDHAVGLFWDNPSRGWVDVGAENKDRLAFGGSAGELRFYVFGSPDLMGVLNRYTELTGRAPLPPMWALGFHISRWSYYPADQVRDIALNFRKRRIPCDAIYLDIHYLDGYRVFTWDRERFPAPAVLISELTEQGFKTIAILDPGVKVDPAYKAYESGTREDIFLKYPDGKQFIGPCWPGNAAFPDFTSPKARAWWASQFETLINPGIAGIWNDMNEPVIFNVTPDNEMPEGVIHDFENTKVSHLEAHNVYGMLMGRASREALEKSRPGKRVFNMIRAAHAGAQRYASTWTGDNHSDWDHLRLSISMVINSGLSGLAFNGPDVGGFFGDSETELFARWIQLGAMMPYFRVHTALGTAPQEPWAFGTPTEDIARKYIEMRYQFLPYFYSLFAQNSQSGWPILRPMFMADPTDEKLCGIEDAFMVGDSLLVAPILEKGQTERSVYLPKGRWFDYETNESFDGGQTIHVSAPLDKMPIFARAGQVIPLWPLQQYVGQVPISELHIKAYMGSGEVTLYEDAGEGTDYESKGDYRWLYFTSKVLASGGFEIDWRRAGKYKPPYTGVRCEVVGIDFEPTDVQLDGAAAPLWYFEKGVVEVTANRPFEVLRIIRPQVEQGPATTLLRSPFKDG